MLYYALSRYYLALPEEEVLASPDLMAALSMVCSVRLEEAEHWMDQEPAEVLAKTSRLAEAYPGYLRRSAGAEQARRMHLL